MPESDPPLHRHCALGDLRSWTDIVTNTMSLSNVRLDQDLRTLLQFGATPQHLLPGFVHEATHHWCFLSPVGFVLSFLQLRARRSGVLLHNGEGNTEMLLRRLVGDVVRYETALAMLRPLAEGLAMFAEFDAISGPDSSVFSVPTELVGWLFSGGLAGINYGGIHLPYEGTRRPLIHWRRSEQCLRRKVAILGHPFEVTTGGYLPGYLALRELWFRVAHKDLRLLNESDLFLMFVRSFFYDDFELVALLLDDAPAEFATSEAIILHIAGRIEALQRVSGDQIRRYEQAVEARRGSEGERGWLMDCLVLDRELAERGSRRADSLLQTIQTPDLESVDGLLALWDGRILNQRDIINFGALPVHVDVEEDSTCYVTAGQTTIHLGHALPGTAAGSNSGSVHVFCSALSSTKARAAVIYRGDERVAIFFGGPDERNQELREQFLRLTAPHTLQLGTEEMQGYVESVLAWDGVAELIGEMRSMLPEVCEAVYATKALGDMTESQRNGAIVAMKEDGLLPVLNWDRKLVTCVALLSIAFSLRLRRPQIIELLGEHGIALADTLTDLAACTAKYGFPKVWGSGDVLLCSV